MFCKREMEGCGGKERNFNELLLFGLKVMKGKRNFRVACLISHFKNCFWFKKYK